MGGADEQKEHLLAIRIDWRQCVGSSEASFEYCKRRELGRVGYEDEKVGLVRGNDVERRRVARSLGDDARTPATLRLIKRIFVLGKRTPDHWEEWVLCAACVPYEAHACLGDADSWAC